MVVRDAASRRDRTGAASAVLAALFWLTSVAAWASPTLSGISPASAHPGERVTLTGSGFGLGQGSSTVSFNGVSAGPAWSWADTQIVVVVPANATPGPVMVWVGGVRSNSVTFNVITPIADVQPASTDFGSVVVGASSSEHYVDVKNFGNAPMQIRAIGVDGANAGDFVLNIMMCPSLQLMPGGLCRLQLGFAPTATGSRSAFVSVVSDAPGSPHQAGLTGLALPPSPFLKTYPVTLSFPSQPVGTASADQSVMISNSGSADLHISSIAVGGPNPADFAKTSACDTATLPPGQACILGVHFDPKQPGNRSADLTITSDALNGDALGGFHLPLSGTAIAATASLSATSLTFATVLVGVSSSAQLTITNNGQLRLQVTGLSVAGAQPDDFPIPSTGCTADPGYSCSFNLTFRPRASGSRSAVLSVQSNATGSPQQVNLMGTGLMPAAAPGPPAKDDLNFVLSPVTPAGQCVFHSAGPMRFTVPITRVVSLPSGPLGQDSMGALLAPAVPVGTGVLSATAMLDMLAYNGSYPSGASPVHEVSLNGTVVGTLSGLPTMWTTTTFTVPIGLLRFRRLATSSTGQIDGLNDVVIAVDKNGTGDTACASVAWARLRFKALSPVVLVHGNGENGAFFVRRGFVSALNAAGVVNDSSINLAAAAGGSATIAANAADLNTQLPGIVSRLGVDSIHLVAHSKGGLDAREWLGKFSGFQPGFRVLSLTTLSTPHRGSALADAGMALVASNFTVLGLPLALTLPPLSPAVPNLTTSFTATFNPALPPAADYQMLGADADLDGNGLIESAGSAGDEYAAARAEMPVLAAMLAANPVGTDAAVTADYQFLRNVGTVRVHTTTVRVDGITLFSITSPVFSGGGGPNDLLVTVPSATGAPFPFVSLGMATGDHAGVARAGIATALLPFLITTDTTIGDLR
jgi:IPT/TIG domain-containing protein/ASPM-SPD-2-Hydin domain-containing protein